MIIKYFDAIKSCFSSCPTDVILPIQIPFSVYSKFMVVCDSMKVSAVAIDKQQEDDIYETETDIALEDPPISIKVSKILCL